MQEVVGLPLAVIAGGMLLFAGVAVGVMGLGALAARGNGTERLKSDRSTARTESDERFRRVVKRLEAGVTPKDGKQIGQVRRRLIRAGWYFPGAVGGYFLARLLLALALPLAFNLGATLGLKTVSLNQLTMGSVALAIFGYLLPALFIDHRTKKRQMTIRRGFPDALDLLLVCVEAGLGLDAAINKVADEIGSAHPLLHEHFRLMSIELQTGRSREEALRSFADRIGIDEVGTLATLLIQSDSLGASIGDTLRTLSDDMRAKRMLAAEEKAQQVGVKLTFPLILLIMPALMLTIGTPAILQVMRKVGPVLARFGG